MPPDSATKRAMSDDPYTTDQHLSMLIHDQLAVANWQRSQNGSKGRNRPKPISPLLQRGRSQRFGKPQVPQDKVRALIAARGPQPSGRAR